MFYFTFVMASCSFSRAAVAGSMSLIGWETWLISSYFLFLFLVTMTSSFWVALVASAWDASISCSSFSAENGIKRNSDLDPNFRSKFLTHRQSTRPSDGPGFRSARSTPSVRSGDSSAPLHFSYLTYHCLGPRPHA